MQPTVAVFDAYGTLLDVHSATARHAARIGPAWQQISQEWRLKQLEYTWVRSLAGPAHHRDFSTLTDAALAFVAARHGIEDAGLLADLRASYRSLDAYPEAPMVLDALRAAGWRTAILSNGSPTMLAKGVAAAGLVGSLDAVLSIEAAGVFKPDPRVYRLATKYFSVLPAQVMFVSSNAWDAFGALEFGFSVAWVNRSGQPDEYGLRGRAREIADLSSLPRLFAA
jgi:2-haloacid dehalogenase